MKKIVFILSLAIGIVVLMSFKDNSKVENEKIFQFDSEKVWEDDYEGWKDVKGQLSLCPLVPLTPLPKLECREGYKCGYNRGFKYGMCKAKGRDCRK